jgi:hypothetical protein
MLTPHWMYEAWLPMDVKQKMAMIAGGACGVMTLVGAAAAETSSVQPAHGQPRPVRIF